MIDTATLVMMIGISSGGLITLIFCLKLIFESNRAVNKFFEAKLSELTDQQLERVKEFSEVTERASKANTSLGDRVKEIDAKVLDLEARISMLRMQR